ncbi:MAG: thioesterase [Gammaproteobacteria bacterium]|nr:thioesterase [Gammaproteobacteria bacterium]
MSRQASKPRYSVECWNRSNTIKQRLICFAYAGAGTVVFQSWAMALQQEVEVCAVRLPGRERLIGEAPFQRLAPLIEWAVEVLGSRLTLPYALFGHSFGALIAFEFARELRRRGLPAPQSLLVSGYGAPQLPRRESPIAGLSDAEFMARIEEIEGTVTEVFAHPELRELILPALRADFSVLENYRYIPEAPFEFPLCAYSGAEDPLVPAGDLALWAELTRANFSRRVFPGNHNYLEIQREALLSEISDQLTSTACHSR